MDPKDTDRGPGERERSSEVPEALGTLPDDRILDVDVREDLRKGQEPFARIMAATGEMREDGVLRVRAIFEPVPLYGVMAKQGLSHWTEELASDDWRVWFFDPSRLGEGLEDEPGSGRDDPERTPNPNVGGESPHGGEELPEDVVLLDVRGLEPPEPMVRTLEALEELPEGATLLHINVREPIYLFPQLEQRGATWKIRKQTEDLVRVFIRKPSP